MRAWLLAPKFDDELLTQRARLLHRVLLAVLLLIVPFGAVGIAVGPKPGFAVAVYGPFAALHVLLLALLRRGHVVAVGRSYVALYFVMIAALVWFVGGVRPNHSVGFVTITLLAGLTVSPRAGILTAVLASLFTCAVAWAEHRGALPPPVQPTGLVEDVTSNVANLVFAAVFVAISMGSLREALARARAAGRRSALRAQQNAVLAGLAPRVVSEPTVEGFADALVRAVAEALGAPAVTAVARERGEARVLAALGDPLPVPDMLPDAASSSPDGRVLAPVPGQAGPRGALIVQLPPEAVGDTDVPPFLATAAAMLGARLVHEEDHVALRQAQKMEVVGRVAGGVAHDFNNLLTTILGCTTLLGENATADDEELLRDVREAAERAALMTRQLLAFSRKQVLRPAPVELNGMVRGFGRMLQRLVRSDVTVRLEPADGELVVLADGSALEQVLLNLAVNAREAMPDGGTLSVRTARRGDEAVLEVEDTGLGMDEATRRRLFEPFFTTKADGTGLGLSTVHGIVERCRGAIDVRTALGEGACFSVRLPVCAPSQRPATAGVGPRRCTGRVLVVDDDVSVRATTRRVLESGGFTVHDVATAAEALEAARSGDFAALVTDVVMPGIGGVELVRMLADCGQALPVLFVSGYVAEHALPGGTFLAKPFTPNELLTAVVGVTARE